MSEPWELSAIEARRRIGEGTLSPVELWTSCLSRIKACNETVNAVVTLDEEAGLAAAKRAEEAVSRGEPLGLLHGLPAGVKDLNETAGLRTTFGSELYADYVPAEDELLAARLRGAGAVIAAKTNTPEFGAGANTWNRVFGATGNPYDPALTCGGSSGGSAVALACGMMPLASGSDLGGSLRTPAGYCGVYGLRPTPRLVPDDAPGRVFNPLSVDGPMARSVEDIHLMLRAMACHDPRDPWSLPGAQTLVGDSLAPTDPRSLKVAFSADLGFAPVSREVRSLFAKRMEALAPLFGSLEPADPPLAESERVFQALRGVGFVAAHLERLRKAPEKVGPNVTANVELGLGLSAEEIARAEADWGLLYRRFLAFRAGYDLLIAPVAAVQPFPKTQNAPEEIDGLTLDNYVSWLGLSFGITLTIHPSLAFPCGRDEKGVPFGIQLIGTRFGDKQLLEMALGLEKELEGDLSLGRPSPFLGAT
ncbi:MAG: amidase family protein [Limibacillus sp.]|jgi:amidase